ncbi:MAG: YbaB/EbfC family nucleoid-associated protein [Proteobacteria bacterium]|nr:YbaB/EbfC family nucleoid-associated protein [Pseudomonadota bacterium]MBS0463762.1 YbaB/EbfC family nucleoid-associated protein [Pseudomonadota bacterium]
MRGNIAQLMQQAQRVQADLKRVQDELALLQVSGQSGGGKVEVSLTGKFDCRRVRIDPAMLDDAEMLEDLIAAAFNDAVKNANAEAARRTSAATAGLPLPPGMF